MPCDDVTYSFVATNRVDCSVVYEYYLPPAAIQRQFDEFFAPHMECYSDLSDYDCFGTDEPTKDPTIDPTFIPTSPPTKDPTADPTIDPTANPTSNPTSYPTNDHKRISNIVSNRFNNVSFVCFVFMFFV
eukprot:765321_1